MAEKLTKLVWDGATDTWSEVELTAEELAQREIDAAAYAEAQAAREAEEAAKAAARASLEEKLAALGISAEELAAL